MGKGGEVIGGEWRDWWRLIVIGGDFFDKIIFALLKYGELLPAHFV